MARERSSSAGAVWAILRKECRSEWRTRYGLNSALLFAVTTLTAVSFVVGRIGDRTDILAALLWVVLMFAALASLSHTFVREVEGHTMTLLRLVASSTAIALGKLLFNLLFLAVLEAVTVPLFLVLMGGPPLHWVRFLEVLGLGEQTTSESSSKVSTLLLPIGSKEQVEAALEAVWPGLSLDSSALRRCHSRCR